MALKKFDELSAMELDVLKEIGSIGTASAATALSGIVNREIRMTIPEVTILGYDASIRKLGDPEELVSAVLVHMSGDMKGCMLFVIKKPLIDVFMSSLLNEKVDNLLQLGEMEVSAINEIGNIMISSYINAMSSLIGVSIDLSVPGIAVNMLGGILSVPIAEFGYTSDKLMMINGNFVIEDRIYDSNILMLPEIESLDFLMRKLGVSNG